MKLQYDNQRDLLYVLFGTSETKAAKTVAISQGVFADFDSNERLLGIEVLEASKIVGKEIGFTLPELHVTSEVA